MLGAVAAIPPGLGIVEGGKIPYQPWALKKRDENRKEWPKLDTEVQCYLPGVPRVTYLPYPFQVFQSKDRIFIAYQYSYARREINMGKPIEAPIDTWMGWSNGRWEGDTLVIEVKGFNDLSWFDRAGNHHSDALTVTERYSLAPGANALTYEARIEDQKTFTRPWTIRMPLYRRLEPKAQLLEYKCVEFAEELLYGELKKKTSS